MSTLEYYKLIRNAVKLYKVDLVSLNCIGRSVEESDQDVDVPIYFQRDVKLLSSNKAEFLLRARIGSDNGPFLFEMAYKGLCVSAENLDKVQFEQYTYDQIVPLVLPYVRECVASTMARMGLPIFTLPTIDVLDTLEANFTSEENQE
ncbi:protein-export chaperone SecB [Cytobacillus oceanisediminis]|uniref:protein-export chaperone SecB n=1 Tax=Cytobacillus oceanisediminis TaxID=665099 RepID=UPI002079F391|nr:protein-export chaperone SecB [Cytobacillus oceanisediminis]USK44666.1 protein-export chaperone SecB [Cytobacillus oceanisediminis]